MKKNRVLACVAAIAGAALMGFLFCGTSSITDSNIKVLTLINNFEFDEAIYLVSEYIEKQQRNPEHYYLLGEAIRQKLFFARYRELSAEDEKSFVKQAENSFLKSLSLDPKMIQSKLGLARLYLFLKNYQKALDYFLEIEKNGIADSEIYEDMAKIYHKIGNPKKSEKYYSLSIAGEKSGDFEKNKVVDECHNFEREDIVEMKGEQYFLKSNILWDVANDTVFSGRKSNLRAAENMIYDVFIGKFISMLTLRAADQDFFLNNEIKNEIIVTSNSKVLLERGVRLIDFEVSIEKRDTVSDKVN